MKYPSLNQENKNPGLHAWSSGSEHGKNPATLLRVPALVPSGGDSQGQNQDGKPKTNNRQKNIKLHQHNNRGDHDNNLDLAESIAKLTAQENSATNTPPRAVIISNRSNHAGTTTDASATIPISADIAESRSRWSALRRNNGILNSMSRANFDVKSP